MKMFETRWTLLWKSACLRSVKPNDVEITIPQDHKRRFNLQLTIHGRNKLITLYKHF